MTKPRFTPDPLPDGLDPTLRAYLQRQFDRAADWWPKDLETRVAGLERTFKYIGGVWPIVDYSTVEFNGSAVAEEVIVRDFVVAQSNGFYWVNKDDRSDFSTFIGPIGNNLGATNVWISKNGQGMYLTQTLSSVSANQNWMTYSLDGGATWSSYEWSNTVRGYAGLFSGPLYNYDTNLWYLLSHSGTNQASGFEVWTSPDFINWTMQQQEPLWLAPVAVSSAFDIDDDWNWVCAGSTSDDYIFTSSDGLTWIRALANDSNFNRAYLAFFKGDRWVYTGSRQSIYTAPKGNPVDVTSRYVNNVALNANAHSVEYNNGITLALGTNTVSNLFRSSGTSFSIIDSTFVTSVLGNNIIYVPDYGWVVGGQSGTGAHNIALSTDDGSTWTELTPTGYVSGNVTTVRNNLRVHNP